MLFIREPLITDPITGTSTFAETFAAQGPRDRQGRSLRELDLRSRLFKHPLSYLVYSPQFDGLPGAMKDYLYQRLHDILTGVDTSRTFRRLTKPRRNAIREILLDTKPDLPDYWRKS